jgi:hypothetical protein
MTDEWGEVWSNTSRSTYADVFWHMLMYAEVCWSMLLAGLCLVDRSFGAVSRFRRGRGNTGESKYFSSYFAGWSRLELKVWGCRSASCQATDHHKCKIHSHKMQNPFSTFFGSSSMQKTYFEVLASIFLKKLGRFQRDIKYTRFQLTQVPVKLSWADEPLLSQGAHLWPAKEVHGLDLRPETWQGRVYWTTLCQTANARRADFSTVKLLLGWFWISFWVPTNFRRDRSRWF